MPMRPMIRYLLPLALVALAGCEKNEKWKVIVNVEIEIDEL